MMYAQVVMLAYRVILTYQGNAYGLHGESNRPSVPVRAGEPHRASRDPGSNGCPAGDFIDSVSNGSAVLHYYAESLADADLLAGACPNGDRVTSGWPGVQITCIFFNGEVVRYESDEYAEIVNLGTTGQLDA